MVEALVIAGAWLGSGALGLWWARQEGMLKAKNGLCQITPHTFFTTVWFGPVWLALVFTLVALENLDD